MAIDDNTSYELYGSQVKDLASRIKRNTAWAKDLAGGETRATRQINMVKLSADDADLIAAQTGESSATILQTMVYGFFDVATERWLNKDELGAAIYASTAEIVYFHDYEEDVDEYPKVTYYESGFDAGNNTYYPVIWLNVHKTNDTFGDGILREVTLGNNSAGLVDWYTPSETTLDLKVDCIIQYIDNATAQTIADEINAANPGASVTSYDVRTYMQFIVRSAKTGRYMTTKAGFINALRDTSRSVFKPDKGNIQMSSILVDKYRTSGDGSYFTIRNILLGQQSTYYVKTANASYGTNAEYMWYIIEQDTIYETQDAWGSYDDTATSYAANSTYQLAYDSSNNLYMASDTNNASDWKQINNDAVTSTLATVATSGSYNDLSDKPTIPTVNDGTLTIQQNGTTVGTFTANQSGNTTVNLAGGIYADDPATPANPNGWITPSDIDWSTFTYSTSEQRVGTWIDGKPIYKKTLNIGNLPNATTKNVAHGISNLDTIIKMEGYAYESPSFVPLPFVSTTATNQIYLLASDTNVIIGTGSNRSGFYGYVTLWYTKTTN